MLTATLLFIVGFIVGAVNSVAGGGMLLGFPMLLAAGLPPIVANATTRIVVVPGAVAATFGYWRYIRRLPRYYWWIFGLTLIGSIVGTIILRIAPEEQFDQIVPYLILFSVAFFALQPVIERQISKSQRRRTRLGISIITVLLAALAVYAGYFGVGYGFMLIAVLSFSALPDIHFINAFKVAASAVAAFVSFLVLLGSGLFDWQAGILMGAGNAVGGYLAARYAHAVSERWIRHFIIIVGSVSGVYLLITI